MSTKIFKPTVRFPQIVHFPFSKKTALRYRLNSPTNSEINVKDKDKKPPVKK